MAKTTKEHIYQVFVSLLNEYELDKIAVTTLVAKCKMSRQTFYYHFKDIQSLINWSVFQSTKGCLEEAKKAKNITAATKIYLTHIRNNRTFITKCLESSMGLDIAELITNSIVEYCTEFNRSTRISHLSGDDAKFVIRFMASGATGLIVNALHNNSDFNVEYLTERISDMIVKKVVL